MLRKTLLPALIVSLLFLSAAEARGPVLWGGVSSNDLGLSTLVLSTQGGQVKIKSLQVVMSCRDTDDGTYSDRAFHIANGPTRNLNRNRFDFRLQEYSGGRLGQLRLNGILRSNGRGAARLNLTALGREISGRIVERCQASVNYRLRRGPVN